MARKEAPYSLSQVLSGERTLEENVIDAGTASGSFRRGSGCSSTSLSPSERLPFCRGWGGWRNGFDYFLIDTGSGVSANVTSFAAVSREIMLVVTPEPTSITDAYALVKTLAGRYDRSSLSGSGQHVPGRGRGDGALQQALGHHRAFSPDSLDYSGCILQDEMLMESVRRRGVSAASTQMQRPRSVSGPGAENNGRRATDVAAMLIDRSCRTQAVEEP